MPHRSDAETCGDAIDSDASFTLSPRNLRIALRPSILLAIIVLPLASLACTVFVGGPAYPSIPASGTAAPQDLQSAIDQAVAEAAQTGVLKLQLTESQLTGYLASQLASQPDPVLSDPLVVLRDGLMVVYGKAQSGMILATVRISTQVTVDSNGDPQIAITQADFGPFPAPEAIKTAVSSLLRETLTGPIGPAAIGFRLDSIAIADGTMTVTGRIR